MKKNKVHLIVAMGRQNQIGLNGTMPWHLSDDLKNFKKITSGHIIIMGRKTFDSIGSALPKRLNFVITSDPSRIKTFEICSFENLEKALDKARLFDQDIFIIGGASVYRQSLPFADSLIITHVDYSGDADTFFPDIDWDKWKIISRRQYYKNQKNEYDFEVIEYHKLK
jgi:dihydrofolate reductase